MLGVKDVAGYLLEQELLTPSAVVHGRLRVEDASRLNRVFVVTVQGARGYVLKLAGQVSREAAILERLSSIDSGRLAACLPAFVAYDATVGALVLEAVPNARDLSVHHARGRFSQALAREAGRALALLHATPPAAVDGLPRAPDPKWRMLPHQLDLDTLRTLSPAAVDLTRIVQGLAPLCTELDALVGDWTEDSLIHGDVRWDNCLAVPSAASNHWSRLRLIDWECCCPGDPAVDVGAFIGEYLRAWMQSIPVADPGEAGGLLPHARLPLRRMRPALRAFWEAYTRQRGASAADLQTTLRRSTRFAAVRLLGAALEEAQALGELRASVLHLVSLSQAIVQRPHEAADLCGLGAWWSVA
jgi:aminoglycoside phosphotransferase (APT) family kinase protein